MEQQPKAETVSRPTVKTVVVKYGYLGNLGEFEYHGTETLLPNHPVLVETDRGIELGRSLCYSCEMEGGLEVNPKQITQYMSESGPENLKRKAGKVVRPATSQDMVEEHHIHADAMNKKRYCNELAERYGLKMKVVCVEHIFGGERIIFYFTSEGRVDFREMVRELAKEYQTRIELRQIGARDEARLLADFEICGRECCCKNFLKTLRPVNMKMAKLQKATLDPSKVSGRCGRLRCCLRYEQKTYEDLLSQLPGVGHLVQTPSGLGRVKDRIVLTQLVQVYLEDDRVMSFPVEELTPAPPGARSAEPKRDTRDNRDTRDSRDNRDNRPPKETPLPVPDEDVDETDELPTPEIENGGQESHANKEDRPRETPRPPAGPGGPPGNKDGRPRRNRGKRRRR
jgi:cell fate regulator YaaT (PSP1 superfamily)